MERTMSSIRSYSPLHRAVIPYVRRMKFVAFELKSFSPFRQDWVYENILQAEKFGDRRIIRKETYKTIPLKEGERRFDEIMTSIQQNYDEKIHVIKRNIDIYE